MEELSRSFPTGLEYDIVYNPTEFIAESVNEVHEDDLRGGGRWSSSSSILFLQTWRASIIPIVAIPVSLIGTFAVMAALGFSLNNLSLFGLVLAIGIVVDDAIVVVENVERNLRQGMSPKEAAHRTMDEVGGALIAIALVLCAVFIPAAFISGIPGQFFRQFAVTIAAATVISCLVSLTLSPALCALLFKPHEEHAAQRIAADCARSAPSSTASTGCSTAVGRLWRPDAAAGPAVAVLVLVGLCGLIGLDRLAVPARAHRLHPRPGPGLPDHRHPAAARLLAGPHRRGGARGDQASSCETEGIAHAVPFAGLRRRHLHQRAQRRRDLLALKPFEERVAKGL